MPPAADAQQLYQDGRLADAIAAVSDALRDDPTDVHGRTFLFELLCFSGAYDRARKQLDAIASSDPEAHLSTAWYQEALHAEEQRQEMFRTGNLTETGGQSAGRSGSLNGDSFEDMRDADPRIGARLETIVGGRYAWIPYEHLARVSIEPPQRLRDLFWIPAEIEGASGLGSQTNEVLLPVMTPLASQHPDELVRLGRATEWEVLESGQEAPVGQKLLLVDGEEYPLLEVRELLFDVAS